jgi:hypothetical protein
MLKNLIATLLTVVLPVCASAETLLQDIGHDGHVDKAVISQQEHDGTLTIYEDEKTIGKFNNLIVDQPALSSDVVALAGGGLAIEIDSDGSRNKYHVVAPISKIDGRLYVGCVYKSVYDSVEGARSVGTSCEKMELSRFDVSGAINADGLKAYSSDYMWLKKIASTSCPNAVGLEYGSYHIARCSAEGVSDTRKQKIIVFDKQGAPIFSVVGYEFIPGRDGMEFVLSNDLSNQTVMFDGSLTCFAQNEDVTNEVSGRAKLAGKFGIDYTLGSAAGCLKGRYSYAGKGREISLRGSKIGGLAYLIELDADGKSSGMFMLDKLLDSGIHGVWIGVPPKNPLTVE